MDHPTIISQLLSAQDSSSVRTAMSKADPGILAAIFDEIRLLAGSNPSEAKKLSRWWPAYLKHGNDRAIAYRIKGVDCRFSGDWLGSAKAYELAGKYAIDPVDQFRFATGAVDALGRAGKVEAAVRLAKRLHQGLLALGEATDAARVCVNAGNALNWHDRYAESAVWFRQSLAEFGDARSLERAAALLGLSTDELLAGSPSACIEHASLSAEIFEELGLTHYARLADLNQAHAELFVGKADAGLSRLLSLRDAFVPDGEEAARTEEFIGDAHLALNRWEEACDAYRTALEMRGMSGLTVNVANCCLGLGQAEMALNRIEQAEGALKKASAGYRKFGNAIWSAIADVYRASILAESGRIAQARKLLRAASMHLRAGKATYYEAVSLLLLASIARGEEHAQALKRARAIIRSKGYVGLAWKVRQRQAFAASGKTRMRYWREMVREMLAHRATVLSTAGSVSFFRDKERALEQYLLELLQEGTASSRKEALEVIRHTRAVALIDEILSARETSPKLKRELEALRKEVTEQSAPDLPGGPMRKAAPLGQMLHLQRRWIEWGHDALPKLLDRVESRTTEHAVALTQAGDELFGLTESKTVRLALKEESLRKQLGWLRYELLAPMVDDVPCEGRAIEIAKELASVLLQPLTSGDLMTLSPDRLLWQVPWQLLGDVAEHPVDVLLATALWPAMSSAEKFSPKSTALWYFPSPGLPHIEREAMAFLERYPDSQVCRTTEEARSCMAQERVDLLHIAAHATFHRSNPMFSSIHLNHGKIVAAEITRAPFRIGMAVLSACDSGAMSLVNRHEPDGLTRSFLARGARWVVATQWPLHDVAAELFVSAFYSSISEHGNVLRATRAGRMRVREELSHPYYWAPFVTYGGYEA